MKNYFRFLQIIDVLLLPIIGFSQTPGKWNVTGNATVSGDFLGTTNNQPLIFYSNNTDRMRLKENGELRINNLASTGNSFVTANSYGELHKILYSNDSNQVLTGAGTFRTGSSFGPWHQNGSDVFLISGNVGIGMNAPQYTLDVNGSAHFNGTVFAYGIALLNSMEADTIKGADMMEVNENLELTAGVLNEVYTKTGDLRLQSHNGIIGNLLLATGTTGKVGVGIYTPQYKLDVNGDMRVSGSIRVHRIVPLPGDTVIMFGDSTIIMSTNTNKIYHSNTSTAYRGMSVGHYSASGKGLNSVAIGTAVVAGPNATNSIVIGAGSQTTVTNLINNIPNCLMVGFDSNIPTFFIGASAGNNTTGRVGVTTTNPLSDFQVIDVIKRINIGAGSASTNGILGYMGYMGFNADINSKE